MITFDDKYRLEDFGFRAYLDHEHQATPEIRRKTMTIPGMAGTWNFGSEIGERHFNIPLKVAEHNQMNLQYKQSVFLSFLFNEFGRPRPIKMSFDYEPDKYYTVEISDSVSPNTAIYHFRNFGLPLVASYPYKQFIAQSDEITWNSDIPIISDITWLYGLDDFEIKAPQTIAVQNDGNLIARPKILINGTANSLTLTLHGESFSFGAINQQIEIDVEKYLVKVNGIEKLNAMTGKLDKLYLMPGTNQIKITGSSLNLTMTIKFRNQYK